MPHLVCRSSREVQILLKLVLVLPLCPQQTLSVTMVLIIARNESQEWSTFVLSVEYNQQFCLHKVCFGLNGFHVVENNKNTLNFEYIMSIYAS